MATFRNFVKYVTREFEEQSSLLGRPVFATKTESTPSNVKGFRERFKGVKSTISLVTVFDQFWDYRESTVSVLDLQGLQTLVAQLPKI